MTSIEDVEDMLRKEGLHKIEVGVKRAGCAEGPKVKTNAAPVTEEGKEAIRDEQVDDVERAG
jgi:hypothetical protein